MEKEEKKALPMFVAVRSQRDDPSFDQLDSRTTHVHISGYPFVWMLELIIQKAPNVTTIRINPGYRRVSGVSYDVFFQKHRIKRIYGRSGARGQYHWKKRYSRRYLSRRHFFRTMDGAAKELFNEMLEHGIIAAEIAARFFCLRGEEYITLAELSLCDPQWKLPISRLSAKISAVLFLLDPTVRISEESRRTAGMILRRLERARKAKRAQNAAKEKRAMIAGCIERARKMGFGFPKDLPEQKIPVYFELLQKKREGELKNLQRSCPKVHRALVLYFGLDRPSAPEYRTMDEVKSIMNFNSRQAVDGALKSGLKRLGIKPRVR